MMEGIGYLTKAELTVDENKAKDSSWYAMIAMRSQLLI
jgi:hypothetical protein